MRNVEIVNTSQIFSHFTFFMFDTTLSDPLIYLNLWKTNPWMSTRNDCLLSQSGPTPNTNSVSYLPLSEHRRLPVTYSGFYSSTWYAKR